MSNSQWKTRVFSLIVYSPIHLYKNPTITLYLCKDGIINKCSHDFWRQCSISEALLYRQVTEDNRYSRQSCEKLLSYFPRFLSSGDGWGGGAEVIPWVAMFLPEVGKFGLKLGMLYINQ